MKGGLIAEATKYFAVFSNLIKTEVGHYSGTPPAPSNSYNPINFWIGEKTVQVECPLMIFPGKITVPVIDKFPEYNMKSQGFKVVFHSVKLCVIGKNASGCSQANRIPGAQRPRLDKRML